MYGSAPSPIAVVETFGELEAEYAALRKGCALLDLPHRGVVRVSGRDRLDFLGRMVTQEMKGFAPFEVRRSFWLSRKGRIDADLRMIQLEDALWIDVDALAAQRTVEGLSSFLFSEDVAISDATESKHRLALHGPAALRLLKLVSTPQGGPGLDALAPDRASMVEIAGKPVLVFRDDSSGEIGLELLLDAADVTAAYEQFLEHGLSADGHATGNSAGAIRMRTAGWHAFNIARIEAGRPLLNIDFGPESLPHECGAETLKDRVSFTKGCYLGQEVVARMQSLGHPKQRLVGLLLDEPQAGAEAPERQPMGGADVLAAPGEPGAAARSIGRVTSSTRSPMLGDRPVCFAQVKWESAVEGTRVDVQTDAGAVGATVRESLGFWSKA